MIVWICTACGSVNEFSSDYAVSAECTCCGERLSAVEKEKIKNKKFLSECAEKKHIGAMFTLYLEEEEKGDYREAFKYLKKCADLNHAGSLYLIAMIYLDIDGNCDSYGVEPDEKKAMTCLKKCYELFGEGGVYFYLYFLLNGLFIHKDEKLALKELVKYADAGVSDCQALLASEYANGTHIKKNDKKAIYWSQRYMKSLEFFDESEAQYDSTVRYVLGKEYMVGKYLKKDAEKSKTLLEESYEKGYEAAGLYLCEFVYPYFPDSLNYKTKRIKILNALVNSEDSTVSRHAQYLKNGQ